MIVLAVPFWLLMFVTSADLSGCQLCQVPDAVFHLMRNTPLTTCDLSGTLLAKIPPKFALKFCLITGE